MLSSFIQKRGFSSSASSTWLKQRLSHLHQNRPEATAVLLVDHSEVSELAALAHLKDSKDFQQDLAMSKSYWFYNPDTMRRTLLLQQKLKKNKDDNGSSSTSDDDLRKEMRGLGVTAVQQLHAKKVDQVQFLVSSKIDSQHLGVFYNSVHLSNYEYSEKCQEQLDNDNEENKGEEQEEVDPRTKRIQKQFSSFEIESHDDASSQKLLEVEDYKIQKASAKATEFARNLGNTRGTEADPAYMQEQIEKLVEGHQDVIKEIRVIDDKKLQELGMNLFYNVGKGAQVAPRCVVVHYQGDPENKDNIEVALVGKGVTFDTGGLNLKPTGYMEDMYGDKGGACAVAGALHGALELRPKKNIIFAFGFAENAIGMHAYKPGDIIKSMKGLTVEIGNTDAEGRLVLADTFTYVQREFKPKKLINLATLTGAVKAALGGETAGLFSNCDDIAEQLDKSGKRMFEPLWRLPINDEHRESMKGRFSDLCNKGKTPYGGASQAAAFLEKFIDKDVSWAHLDIAGPAMLKAAKPPMCADNTGFGTQLLIDFLLQEPKEENKKE